MHSRPDRREYVSPHRQRQAQQTRSDILDAAQRLLAAGGYAATTMAAIAREAGVAPATVYGAFRTKAGVLAAIYDRAVTGDDLPVALADRPAARQVMATADPRRRFTLLMEIVRGANERVLPLIEIATLVEPEVAGMLADNHDRRHQDVSRYGEAMAQAGMLRGDPPHDVVFDLVWALISPEVYRMLVHDRGWTPEQYEQRLTRALALLCLPPDRSDL